ncbi:hypothetical protein Aes012_101 [Aeromonas phage Aes012]|uniref:Uncharacterized protein n=3 Tax=Tulanevirus TaxID=2560244 RepID=A0A2S1PDX8_9CAUD|nr:hypothetical protein Aes012_101 [Aeromonas phage Aes012]YP_010095503.1 hypothetical protein KNT90_gp020 [Aeromonas phage 50AhydR13PP]YP_010095791.1 hypothetical protein KNT91_gp063 [Aeromonas phage 60AhydR15PP]UYD57762.1 hypothetical protein MEIMHGIN_00120 [Aeromonas phage avDM3]AFN69731.1 putative phage protein [Aeromonas phage Aes012]AWH14767.1 hypothetical protein [Aeromonas phage 50AhydR13PP]AWH15587.1 hypothetical protein [Aeromonas phage 60AhydR15PP]
MAVGKWQQCGPVMNRIFECAIVELLGEECKGIIIHSYRDAGDVVLVNYELMYRGRVFIGQTSMVP